MTETRRLLLFPDLESHQQKKNPFPRKRGRKPLPWRQGAPHRKRVTFTSWSALHVTLSLRPGLPSLRNWACIGSALRAFRACKEKEDFRILAWTIQSNHLHLVVEAGSSLALTRNLQGLQVRLAKGWNRLWKRKSPVFAGRFHARLVGPKEDPRRLLAYVLKNHMRHGRVDGPCFDGASSSLWMDVWLERDLWERERGRMGIGQGPVPVAEPKTEGMKAALRPGALSLFGRPRGYNRVEFLRASEVEGEK